MRPMSPVSLAVLVVSALSLSAGPARAAAYYVGEMTTRALSRGGAFIVNPADPSAIWLNPASVANAHGVQLYLDNTVVFLSSEFSRDCGPSGLCGPVHVNRDYGGLTYRVDGDGRANPNDEERYATHTPSPNALGRGPSLFADGHKVVNTAAPQYIPRLLATFNLDSFGLPGLAAGVGLIAPNGADYAYAGDQYTRYTLIDRDLVELYYAFTLAYRHSDWIAVGASIQGVTAGMNQTVKLSADPYGNEDPDYDMTVKIDSWAHFIPSANFGVWVNPIFGLELGGSVQLGRKVQSTGNVEITELGPGIEELTTPGANGVALLDLVENNPTATLSFTLPPIYRVGARYAEAGLFDGWFGFDLELDFVYEQWSTFDHVAIETSGLAFAISGGDPQSLDPIVQPKDYQDSWSVRLGGEVNFMKELIALRSGVFYETAAIPNSTYSVELTNGEKVGVGVGAGLNVWGVRLDLGYSFMYLFDRQVGDESIVHVENVAPPVLSPGEKDTRLAMGTYKASYNLLALSINVAFDEVLGFGVVQKPAWERSLLPGS